MPGFFKKIIVFILLLIVAAFFYYYHHDLSGMRKKRENYLSQQDFSEIHVGVIWPKNQEVSSYIHGQEMALDEIKNDKKFPYSFHMHFVDEDSPRSVEWKFLRDHRIVAVVGGLHSGTVKRCAPLFDNAGILFLQSGTNPFLMIKNSRLMLEVSYSDIFHAENIIKIIKFLGMKKIALLYSNSEYCKGLKSLFAYQIRREQDIFFTSIYSFDQNFSPASIYADIIKSDFDGIIFFGYENEAIEFLKYIKWCKYDKPFIGNETLDVPKFYSSFNRKGLEGVFCSSYDSEYNRTRELREFSERYWQRFKTRPDYLAVWGYSAVMLLKKSIEHSPVIFPDVMRQSIIYSDFSILGMKFKYTADGILKQNLTTCKKWVQGEGFVQFTPDARITNKYDWTNEFFK